MECSTASSTWELPRPNPEFLPTCMRKSEGNREPWVGFNQVTEIHFCKSCNSMPLPATNTHECTGHICGPGTKVLFPRFPHFPAVTATYTTWRLHLMKFKASFRSCEIIQWPTFYVCEKFDKTSAPIVCPRKEEWDRFRALGTRVRKGGLALIEKRTFSWSKLPSDEMVFLKSLSRAA